MSSGWERGDCGALTEPVSLLHDYEGSLFGAALGRGPAQLETGLQEVPQRCGTVGDRDGKGIVLATED